MKKRIISILLAVCLVFGLLPVGVFAASATSGSCGKNATWSYNTATKTLSISGSGDMADYHYDPVMGEYNRPPWDTYREEIEHVIINEGITSIGQQAFGSTWVNGNYPNLCSVSIAPTVTKIGAEAFAWAQKLESIELPNVTSIGYAAFNGTGIRSIYIPPTMEEGEGDVDSGLGWFINCTNLQSITVDPGNQTYRSVDGVLFSGDILLRYPAGKTGSSYTIPNGTARIALSAFEGNENITSVSVPASVSRIDAFAFNGCTKLQNITIAEGVTLVCSNAFCGTALTSIVLPASVRVFTSDWTRESSLDMLNRTFYFTGTRAPEFDTYCCNVGNGYKTTIYYPENATGWDAVQQQDDVKSQVEAGVLEFRTGTPSTEPSEPTDELKPPVLQVSSDSVYEGESVILSWNQIPNASAYILKTVDPEGNESEKTLLPEKTTTSIVNLSLGTYKFSIAVRTRDRETSDFSNVVTVKVSKKSLPVKEHDFYWDYMYGFGNNTSGMSEGYYLSTRDRTSLFLGSSPLSKITIGLCMAEDSVTGWDGSCYGFAVSSFLFFHDKLSIAKYTNDKSAKTVRKLPNTKTVQSLINYYQFHQFSAENLPRQLRTKARGNDKNLRLLIDYLNDSAAVILSFQFTKNNETAQHTVIAYGAIEQDSKGYQLAEKRYMNKIRLYDSNEYGISSSNDYDGMANLYYNINSDGTYDWAIGGYGTAKDVQLVITDINYSLKAVDYNNIEDMTPWELKNIPPILSSADNAQKYMFILANNKSNAQIARGTTDYGKLDEGNKKLIPIYMSSDGADGNSTVIAYALPNDDVITLSNLQGSEPLCIVGGTNESAVGASFTVRNGADVQFNPDGEITFSGRNMEYSVSFADNSMAAGWPIIQIDGTKADNVELSRTENGMIISGDLTNAKVTGTDGITDVCGQMPRGYDEVLVNGSVEAEKLYIYADKDGDSEFETLVTVYTGDHGNTDSTGEWPQTGTLPTNSISFTDVSKTAYFYDAVLWAVENGITTGTSRTRFSPYATCTRAQAVTFLWRVSGSPAPKNSRMPFIDVSPSAYYYDAVLWALEKGITTGTSSTTFSPDAVIDRAQAVTFLYRANGAPSATEHTAFTDVPQTAYYADAVKWAVDHGITTGTSATAFSPNASCTRAQIVTFLYRAR